jgi:hypothetical protein
VRPALAGALAEHEAVLRRGLERAPQTNEVGRSAPLLGALRHVSDWSGGRPVRLFEIGASGGLNLRVDRLPIGPGLAIDSPIPLPAAPPFEVVERVGGDLHPVDPATTEGRLTLTSYVWPDDARRLERLRSALAIAQDEPAQLLRIGAADLVESIELRPGLVTVLWHSVMWQYVEAVERARVHAAVARLGEQASAAARFAYVRFEWEGDPTSENDGYHVVRLSTWPDGPGDGPSGRLAGRALGTAPAHGAPVAWQPAG